MKKIFINHSVDPAFNLALEELLASGSADEAVMLWRNAPSVIVGRNQNTLAEIDPVAVRERNIQVVRRITGGGAVYHDLGNVNYTIAVDDRQLDSGSFARNARMIIDVLRKFDVPAEFSGRNDILVDGRKISGSAKSVLAGRTLFHGTLLFDTDLSVLSQVLNPDEEKIRAKGIKSVRARVANLKEFLPEWDTDRFIEEMAAGLLQTMEVDAVSEIPAWLSEKAEQLANSQYRSWEWNYGSVTAYSYQNKKRFACGGVEIGFNVRDNRICDMAIKGDFFGMEPSTGLAEKINGSIPRLEDIAAKLAVVDISDYISGISKAEFLTLFKL